MFTGRAGRKSLETAVQQLAPLELWQRDILERLAEMHL